MSQLGESDKSGCAAVSPDGKYIAENRVDGSVVLRPVGTNSFSVLVPGRGTYYGTTFSRDGNDVYYVRWAAGEKSAWLYKVSVSGGDSQKVLENVESAITFSPDGQRFAFVRNITSEETGLVIANADGSDERLLGSRRSPDFFASAGPSWSPDGELIACAVYVETPDKGSAFMTVAGVRIEDGSEKLLANGKWANVSHVAWLADNSGFIMAAKEKRESAFLWHVSYPGGESRRITNDPSNYPIAYSGISLTSDSRTLVASRFEMHTNLWAAPPGDPGQISQITFGGNHLYRRLAWTPDGRILFPSDASGDREVWIMEADGTGQKQLTAEGDFNELPAASPDGRYIVFTSSRTGKRTIWRMNTDGSDPIQLTRGENDFGAQCSPDSLWVVYMSSASGKVTAWKTTIDGGEPVQLTEERSFGPVVSPDGTRVACWWWSPPKSPPKIAVIYPWNGPILGQPLRKAFNMWEQTLDGGEPRQLTHFPEPILVHAWSRDGKQLAVLTARYISDVVMMSSRE